MTGRPHDGGSWTLFGQQDSRRHENTKAGAKPPQKPKLNRFIIPAIERSQEKLSDCSNFNRCWIPVSQPENSRAALELEYSMDFIAPVCPQVRAVRANVIDLLKGAIEKWRTARLRRHLRGKVLIIPGPFEGSTTDSRPRARASEPT